MNAHRDNRRASHATWAGALASLLLLAACGEPSARPPASVQVLDLADQSVDSLLAGDFFGTLFVFIATDCPVSNAYVPEIRRIHETFGLRGVSVVLVYPNPSDTPEKIEQHVSKHDLPKRALRDPEHRLVRHVEAKVTPEAALFFRSSGLVYHGRIDDWYEGPDTQRANPTVHDLTNALEAALTDEPVKPAGGDAVGTPIAEQG